MNTIHDRINNDYGLELRYWGAHTFSRFLSADKYFKTNPEFFAYRNGQRVENGQPCLSNPIVMTIIIVKIIYSNCLFS